MISIGWYWLIYDGTGSGSGWYLVVLGQNWAVLFGTWWYWVSITRYCLVLSGIGSKCFYVCIVYTIFKPFINDKAKAKLNDTPKIIEMNHKCGDESCQLPLWQGG